MTTRYQHRIGVRSELFFDLVLDDRNPSLRELTSAVVKVLRQAANDDGGLEKLNVLPAAAVYPDWNSVDVEIEPEYVLDSAAVRSVDCVEINSVQ